MFLGFFIIKPTRCINFLHLLRHATLQVSESSSAHRQDFIHCTLISFRAGPSWSCSKAVFKPVWHILVPSVQWINSWWWAEELPETCRVSCWSKFGKSVHLVGFIIKKFVTMQHGHTNVKFMFLGYVIFQLFCSYYYWQRNNVISQVERFALLLQYCHNLLHILLLLLLLLLLLTREN
jgi:hypothetical protein